jgi:hypothetical protein
MGFTGAARFGWLTGAVERVGGWEAACVVHGSFTAPYGGWAESSRNTRLQGFEKQQCSTGRRTREVDGDSTALYRILRPNASPLSPRRLRPRGAAEQAHCDR